MAVLNHKVCEIIKVIVIFENCHFWRWFSMVTNMETKKKSKLSVTLFNDHHLSSNAILGIFFRVLGLTIIIRRRKPQLLS